MHQVFLIAPQEHLLNEKTIAFEKPSMFSIPQSHLMEMYTKRLAENIGIGAIASCLREYGISTKCINLSIEDRLICDVVEEIIYENPRIVGISILYDLHVYNAMKIAVLLRKQGYAGHITLGGTFISLAYERFLKAFSIIDSIIVGDGEVYKWKELKSIEPPAHSMSDYEAVIAKLCYGCSEDESFEDESL